MMSSISTINRFLLVLRVVICCLPLPGYIHPDEFFQSSEVIASDVLGFKTTRTWEWNENSPSRSIIFPAITSGLPFLLVKILKSVFGAPYATYLLLVLPRLFITLSTYLIDILLEKMTDNVYILNKDKEKSQQRKDICVFLFRSSAVTTVFLTRTFSNTVETILLTIFLWKLLSQKTQKDFSKGLNLTTVILTGITILGFFIRPTFLLFAAFGCLVYTTWCLKHGKLLSQIIIALLAAIICSFVIICIDSMYFSSSGKFQFTITPLNLIKYNLDEASLKLHGEHPRFLHLFLNCPLLFGPLFATFILATAEVALFSFNTSAGKQREFYLLLLASSTWLALFLLSYFRHQEPRYIIPIISAMALVSAWTLGRRPNLWTRFVRFWVIFNAAFFAWFGFIHQGGVIPCLSHLNKAINLEKRTGVAVSCVRYDVLFWYTYMAPQHLLPTLETSTDTRIFIHNLGSLPQQNLEELLRNITVDGDNGKEGCTQKVNQH